MANILDTSLALGSIPYNFVKGVIGNPSNPGATTQVSLTNTQKNYLDNIAQLKGTSGNIDYSDYGSPTKTFSGISNMNALEASLATTMGGTGYTTNPDGSINYTGGAYDFGHGSNNFVTNFINKGGIMGAADSLGKNIYGYIHGPQMKFKQQQLMNRRKQNFQDIVRRKEEAAKQKAAADAAAKAKADAAAAAKATSSFDPSGPTQASIRRDRADKSGRGHSGGFTDPGKGSYGPHKADGGLINFYKYGGFI